MIVSPALAVGTTMVGRISCTDNKAEVNTFVLVILMFIENLAIGSVRPPPSIPTCYPHR